MEPLNAFYVRLLHVGFIVLQQASDAQDLAWIQAELDLLHNVPSLIDESNLERHRYFWFVEREHYKHWMRTAGRDQAKSRMATYYEPLWCAMEPVLLEYLAAAAT